jgi:hypothetical protein
MSMTPSPDATRQRVTVGLNGGAHLEGWLIMRGARTIIDLLNNWDGRSLVLERDEGYAVLIRDEVVWIGSQEPTELFGRRSSDHDTTMLSDHPLRVLAGPFELVGSVRAYRDVHWSDYLLARAGAGFILLKDASVRGPSGGFEVTNITLNVSRIAAVVPISDAARRAA